MQGHDETREQAPSARLSQCGRPRVRAGTQGAPAAPDSERDRAFEDLGLVPSRAAAQRCSIHGPMCPVLGIRRIPRVAAIDRGRVAPKVHRDALRTLRGLTTQRCFPRSAIHGLRRHLRRAAGVGVRGRARAAPELLINRLALDKVRSRGGRPPSKTVDSAAASVAVSPPSQHALP